MLTDLVSERTLVALVYLCLIATAAHVNATDRISEPPDREAFLSPGACFEFVISMNGEAEEWTSSGSNGYLFRKEGGNAELRWTKRLPHAYRPRFAFVNDDGFVILLDQWINVAGPHAVTVFDPQGKTIASYDFYDIADVVGVPGREIVPQAKHGAWMASEPQADVENNSVRVAVGGKGLDIQFDTGSLTVVPGH